MTYYLVRLTSSRGTDQTFCLKFKAGTSKQDVREGVEFFIDNYVRNTAITEYSVTYHRVKMLDRTKLLQKHDKACKRYYAAKTKKDAIAAMLNPKANSLFYTE